MEGEDDGHPAFPHQLLQNVQKLQLSAQVQEGGGLVQDQDFRLLTDGPGQQHPLPLAIADLIEGGVPQFQGADPLQGRPHRRPVPRAEDPQPPGIGIAAGGGHLPAGHPIRLCPAGHHHRQAPGDLPLAQPDDVPAQQADLPAQQAQLPDQAVQNRGFARAVWPDEGQDLPRMHLETDLPEQRASVIPHRQIPGGQQRLAHGAFPPLIRRGGAAGAA